jgi:hypothetical protein
LELVDRIDLSLFLVLECSLQRISKFTESPMVCGAHLVHPSPACCSRLAPSLSALIVEYRMILDEVILP